MVAIGANLGGNLDTIKEQNLSVTLRLIQRTKGLSRIDLSRLTGLRQATITKILTKLIEYDLIEETHTEKPPRGRPPVSLELKGTYYTVGIQVTRGYIAGCSCNIAGKAGKIFEDTYSGDEELAEKAVSVAKKVLASTDAERVLGIGVAYPRNYGGEKNSGEIAASALESLGYPVFTEHDAVCAALNEYLFVNSEKPSNLCCVATYKGIGAAFLNDGEPYRGGSLRAGEIGHMIVEPNGIPCRCGARGCLENYCSTSALERVYEQQSGKRLGASEILELVNDGDGEAMRAFSYVCDYLAIGLVNIVRTLDPDEIVIPDRLAIAAKALESGLDRRMFAVLPRNAVKLTVRKYDKTATMRGANAVVFGHALNAPCTFFEKYVK